MLVRGRYERAAIADYLNPVNGYRGQMELCGMTPKDHRKDNLKYIKSKQEEVKSKLEEAQKPKPEPFKLKKFQNVQSKVSLATIDTESPSKLRPKTAASARPKSGHLVAFGRTTQDTVEND